MWCSVTIGRMSLRRCSSLSTAVFYFFQAEVGIRDIGVTGVQTCALPISRKQRAQPIDKPLTRVGTQMSRQWLVDRLRSLLSSGEQGKKLALDISRFRKAEGIALERSEERRVGKEGRSRRSPYH